MQVFYLRDAGARVPLLAAVGPLQFEVVQYRLETEYGAPSRLESAPWELVKWLKTGFRDTGALRLPTGCRVAWDADEEPVILFPSNWTLNYFQRENPDVTLFDLAQDARA